MNLSIFDKLFGNLKIFLNMFNNKQSIANSPGAKQAGRDLYNYEIQQNIDVPEFSLHLYGAGSKRKIEGHIEKNDNRTLVIESIRINNDVTDLNRQFTKLLMLKNINHTDKLFTARKENIEVEIVYKTLTGDRFTYSQGLIQTDRDDGLFNVSLQGYPSISSLIDEGVDRALYQLEKELKKANRVTGLASIRMPRIERIYKKWVNDNQEVYFNIQNSRYKGRLNAILLSNNLASHRIS